MFSSLEDSFTAVSISVMDMGLFRLSVSSFFRKKKYMLIYLVTPGLSCSMWDLVPCPGIKLRFSALGAQSLSHWTSREVFYLFPLD